MSQNTLKVNELHEDAEFDENGAEIFDEKALVENDHVIMNWQKKSCCHRVRRNVF